MIREKNMALYDVERFVRKDRIMTNEKTNHAENVALGTVILVGLGIAITVGGMAIVKKIRKK